MKPISKPIITSRHQLVDRIRRELERRGYPRLQMLLLVMLTGGAGFIASYSLLVFGVETLALRYVLAVTVAYIVFLLLLWVWLRTDASDYDGFHDIVSEVIEALPDGAHKLANRYQGGGGQFGGGGASHQWDAHSEPLVELPDIPVPSLSDAADADEFAIPLAVILIVIGIVLTVLLASASVIYSAPMLFAEMLVDGVLAASLYRRLRRLEQRHWLQAAIRRTVVPFIITTLLLGAAGWSLSVYAPEARTLAEAISSR